MATSFFVIFAYLSEQSVSHSKVAPPHAQIWKSFDQKLREGPSVRTQVFIVGTLFARTLLVSS